MSNSIGRLVGPLRLTIGFHGTGPAMRGFSSRRGEDVQRFGDLAPGQVGAQAVVHAAAEGQYRRCSLAGDVDAVRVVVDRRITVGRSGIHHDHRAGGEEVAVELDVLDDQAKGSAGDRRVAHGLLDRAHRQFGVLLEQLPLLRVLAQHVHRGGHLVAGGVGARQQQAAGEHAQFGGVEAIAVVLGANQVGEQVVGQAVPAPGDHVVDVVVELAPRAHDDRLDFAEIDGEAEGLEDVVGPERELLPVLAGRAEQRADDRDGVGARDVGDDVAAARVGDLDRPGRSSRRPWCRAGAGSRAA